MQAVKSPVCEIDIYVILPHYLQDEALSLNVYLTLLSKSFYSFQDMLT